ncbi:MAG TPA: rod shape-determining protein RodA [Polyangiaceae bacterium]|nr:rod shape-determining protein RodA [Polyangiaceae bacterium]
MRGDRVSFRGGPQVDMALLLAVVAILTLGLVNLYSATSVYVENAQKARLADIYVSQIYWIVVGTLLAILAAAIDYRHFERLALLSYAGGLVALGLVFVLSGHIRGARRWIEIGSFQFQPSEFMKIVLILAVARMLHNDPKTEPRTLLDLAKPFALVALPAAAVMAQPDLGTATLYLLITGSMLAMTKIKRSSLLTLIGVSTAVVTLAWQYVLLPYQKARVTSFLNPELDKTGTGWHALQSQTAIGNGQLLGEGFMQGTQNQFKFLPDQYSDFPFAVFAEDWGLLGSVVLLSLYCFAVIWAIHVGSQAKDRFGAALAIGVGAMLFWHTVCNVGMATGIMPVVGITLPLFSYGGSNVVTMMIGLGLLMNVSMRR